MLSSDVTRFETREAVSTVLNHLFLKLQRYHRKIASIANDCVRKTVLDISHYCNPRGSNLTQRVAHTDNITSHHSQIITIYINWYITDER